MPATEPPLLPTHLDHEHFVALASVEVLTTRTNLDNPSTSAANSTLDRIFRHGRTELRLRDYTPITEKASRQHLDELVSAGLLVRVPTSPGKRQAVTLTDAGREHLDPKLADQVEAVINRPRHFTILDQVLPPRRTREHRPMDPANRALLDDVPDEPQQHMLAIFDAVRVVGDTKTNINWLISIGERHLLHSRLDYSRDGSVSGPKRILRELADDGLIHLPSAKLSITAKGIKKVRAPLVELAIDMLTRNHDYTIIGGLRERLEARHNLLAALVALHQVNRGPATLRQLDALGHELVGTELSLGPWPDLDIRRNLNLLRQELYLAGSPEPVPTRSVDKEIIIEVNTEGWDAADDSTIDRVRRHIEGR